MSTLEAGEPASVSPDLSRQAWEMVQALGSEKYVTRVHARSVLMQLGRAAIQALEYAVKSDDAEVRLRAGEILIALRGRGFMGVGLQEQDDIADDSEIVSDGVVVPPVVVANQVVSFKAYEAYGVVKPFPAESAGMQQGDKILAINGRPLHGVKDLMREVIIIGPARLAVVLIERDGKRIRLPILLTRNPVLQRNGALGPEIIVDPPPPVDLEKEPPAADKQTALLTAEALRRGERQG